MIGNGGPARRRQALGRQPGNRLAALKARLGADEAMRLLVRATEALDLLGIDRKEGIWLALHGAERLADEPGIATAELAEELRQVWARRNEPEPAP